MNTLQFHQRSSLLAAAAGLAVSALSTTTLAQTLSWINAVGGSASTSGNWSPAAVPGAANDLLWNLNNIYGVSWNASVIASRTHTYRDGTVTLTMSSPHTTSNGVTIGSVSGDNPVVALSSGTWTSSFNSAIGFDIGDVAGAVGTLNVTDDSADLLLPGTAARMRVGVGGAGTLSISGGGRVECGDGIIVGSNGGSSGTLTVSGAQAVSPFQRSTLLCVDATGLSHFGSSGSATVNISNGALVDIASFLHVSEASASTTTVTIGGSGGIGGILDATLDVAGDVRIGANASAAAAGTGTITVNSNGQVLVGGTLGVGDDPNGGTGTLNINTGSLVQATNVIDGALGTINHGAGTLKINGGTYTGFAVPLTVTGTGSPTLQFSNNAAQSLAGAGGVGLIVGNNAGAGTFTGNLIIDSGADVVMSGLNNDINIGDDTGTTGIITVTGAGSRLVDNQPGDLIRVGVNGTGELRVESGGEVLANEIQVPASSLNGNGTLFTPATGATITTANLSVGNAAGGAGGANFNPGTVLNVTNAGIGMVVRNTGDVAVGEGATINASGTILLDGGALHVHGEVHATTLVDVDSGGLLRSGPGTAPLVDACVHVRSGGAVEAISDDLTMGDATSPTGFVTDLGGTITIGATTLTLLDSNEAVVSGVTLAGGTLAAPNDIDIANNGTIDGTGTITTPQLFFNSGGSIITATGAAGITINGKLRNNSGSIDGTKFTFNDGGPNSGWTGAGAINAQVVFNSGTEVNALAGMSIGNNTAAGVTFNSGSRLNVDTRIVTFFDSNGLGLPTLTTFGTTLGGGTIACSQPLVLNAGRSLEGHGTVQTPALTSFGNLRPREFPVDNFARINLTGTLTLGTNSDTFFDIFGDDVDTRPYDRITATGAVTITGADAAIHVAFANGFVPVPGTLFSLITGSTCTGVFPIHNIPARTKIDYGPNFVALLVLCPADFNEDGTVDFFDYLDFVDAFSANLPAADFNRDSSIDFFDYLDFVDAFSAGC